MKTETFLLLEDIISWQESKNQFWVEDLKFERKALGGGRKMNLEKLNALKTKGKFSNERISKLSGIPVQTVGRIFRGEGSPTFDNIAAIAKIIGGDLNDLAGLAHEESQNKDELIRVQEITIKMQNTSIEEKRKYIKWMAVTIACLVAVIIVFTIIDRANGSIGWLRH